MRAQKIYVYILRERENIYSHKSHYQKHAQNNQPKKKKRFKQRCFGVGRPKANLVFFFLLECPRTEGGERVIFVNPLLVFLPFLSWKVTVLN